MVVHSLHIEISFKLSVILRDSLHDIISFTSFTPFIAWILHISRHLIITDPLDMYFFSLTQSVSTLPFMEIRGCNVTSFLFRRSVRGFISVKYDSHYYFLSVKTYNFVKSRLQLSTKPTGVGCLVNSSRLNGQLQSAFNS